MKLGHWILDENGTPQKAELLEWAEWFECSGGRERFHLLAEVDDAQVSTIFLGLDHNFFDHGPPILFETMIFGGPLDHEQWRYATWKEAEAGHLAAVAAAEKAHREMCDAIEDVVKPRSTSS